MILGMRSCFKASLKGHHKNWHATVVTRVKAKNWVSQIKCLEVQGNSKESQKLLVHRYMQSHFELWSEHSWVKYVSFLVVRWFSSTVPVGMADCALPAHCSHTYAALAADPVAAAAADSPWVPELSQGPLAPSAGPLTILPGRILRTSPSKLLELTFHPPEVREHGKLQTTCVSLAKINFTTVIF